MLCFWIGCKTQCFTFFCKTNFDLGDPVPQKTMCCCSPPPNTKRFILAPGSIEDKVLCFLRHFFLSSALYQRIVRISRTLNCCASPFHLISLSFLSLSLTHTHTRRQRKVRFLRNVKSMHVSWILCAQWTHLPDLIVAHIHQFKAAECVTSRSSVYSELLVGF